MVAGRHASNRRRLAQAIADELRTAAPGETGEWLADAVAETDVWRTAWQAVPGWSRRHQAYLGAPRTVEPSNDLGDPTSTRSLVVEDLRRYGRLTGRDIAANEAAAADAAAGGEFVGF